MTTSGGWKEPTIRECWDQEHSWENFKDCLSLLIPASVYQAWRRVRYPRRWWAGRQKEKWINTLHVGDEVCSCFGHVTIARFIIDPEYLKRNGYRVKRDVIVDTDGGHHSLWNCCAPILEDATCHAGGEWLG